MGGRSVELSGEPAQPIHFEWDPAKSASNKEKHGIDFDEAMALWQDGTRTEIPASTPEPRLVNIGYIKGKIYTVVTTERGEAIRIISARRASTKERADYVRRNSTSRTYDQHGRV